MGARASCIARTDAVVEPIVLDLEGNALRLSQTPVTAAEAMLESPGHAVSSAETIRRTGRAAALGADEELRPGVVYVMVPLGKVGSRVAGGQMAAIEAAVRGRRKGPRRVSSLKKVFPATAGSEIVAAEEEGDGLGFPSCRVRLAGRWKPVLDAIRE